MRCIAAVFEDLHATSVPNDSASVTRRNNRDRHRILSSIENINAANEFIVSKNNLKHRFA
jgi:hypothetical protein